jgi:hypothetical protein
MSKRVILWVAGALLCAARAHAQTPLAQTPNAGSSAYRVDVTVPEPPALLLTGQGSSALTRASTIRDLSAAFSGFTDEEGNFSLPAAFSVEIAPRLLFFGRGLRATDYAGVSATADQPLPPTAEDPPGPPYRYRDERGSWGERAWSTLRVSAATYRAGSGNQATNVALGFRTAPVNDADPRLNARYRRRVRELLQSRNILNDSIQMLLEGYPGPPLKSPSMDTPAPEAAPKKRSSEPPPVPRTRGDTTTVLDCTPVHIAGAAPVSLTCVATRPMAANPDARVERLRALRNAVNDSINNARQAFADSSWNARTLEFAAGASMIARDSTGRSPRPGEYATWVSYTEPLTRWSQGLLGARLRSARDTASRERGQELLMGGRVYMGRNSAKAMVEAQLSLLDDLGSRPYAGAGAEVRVFGETWATFAVGVERAEGGRPSRLVSRFSLRSGRPYFEPTSSVSQTAP